MQRGQGKGQGQRRRPPITLEILQKIDKKLLVDTFWKWKAERDEKLKIEEDKNKKKTNSKSSTDNVPASVLTPPSSIENETTSDSSKPKQMVLSDVQPVPGTSKSFQTQLVNEKVSTITPNTTSTDMQTTKSKKNKKKKRSKTQQEQLNKKLFTELLEEVSLEEVKLFTEDGHFQVLPEEVIEFENIFEAVGIEKNDNSSVSDCSSLLGVLLADIYKDD